MGIKFSRQRDAREDYFTRYKRCRRKLGNLPSKPTLRSPTTHSVVARNFDVTNNFISLAKLNKGNRVVSAGEKLAMHFEITSSSGAERRVTPPRLGRNSGADMGEEKKRGERGGGEGGEIL